MSNLLKELQRRNVIKAAISYVVIAWTLLQVAALVVPILKISESILRFILIGLIIGFPFWLIFAYRFEWTPTGLKKTDDIDPEPAVQKQVNKRLDRIIILFLSLAVVLLITDRLVNFGASSDLKIDNIVAVLPFENQTGDQELEYLADGMSQEICDRLTSMKGLTIIGRRACLRFKNNNKSSVEIAKELKVKYLVEGNIRKSGNKIRINSQLINGSTGVQMASIPYTGTIEMGKILNTMDEAALQVARELHLNLNPQEIEMVKRRYTENNQAYNSYLKGWMLFESLHTDIYPSKEKLDGAKEFFEKAIQQDSAFALAYAGLSMIESFYIFTGNQLDYDLEERSLALANKALDLDANLPEGHMALAELAFVSGKFNESISFYEESLNYKPENPIGWCHLGLACLRADKYDSAENAANMAIKQQPTYVWSHFVLGQALQSKKMYREAIEAFNYVVQLEPSWSNPYYQIGGLYLELKEYENALDIFKKIEQINPDGIPFLQIAFAYAGLGKKELALNNLEEAFQAGYTKFSLVESSPHIKNIKNDMRFEELLDKYQNQKLK